MVERTMCRALDHLDIDMEYNEWGGVSEGP